MMESVCCKFQFIYSDGNLNTKKKKKKCFFAKFVLNVILKKKQWCTLQYNVVNIVQPRFQILFTIRLVMA